MSDNKRQRINSSLEVSDENGIITTLDLPTLDPSVTLTIQAQNNNGGKVREFQFELDLDDEGNPQFTLIVNSSDRWVLKQGKS